MQVLGSSHICMAKLLQTASVLCPTPYTVSHIMRKIRPITASRMDDQGHHWFAGQKSNAGATPQHLDILVGRHDRLKCGMVILVAPKKDRNSWCGTLKNKDLTLHILDFPN